MNALRAVALALLCVSCLPAWAGRPCENAAPTPQQTAQALELARRAYDLLDASGAQVALIGRAGQDLSRYGQRYSHLALVWRDHPEGRWSVVHELNECGTAESALYNEGLGNFFLDNMFAYEAVIAIPAPATQARLAELLAGPDARALHEPRYNMLAYPFSAAYQNSNQWVLEVLAAASGRAVLSRAAAQDWLRRQGFQPATIRLNTAERLGARMFRANVAFDDQPLGRRMAGQIDTVSVDAVLGFLGRREREAQVRTVALPAP